MWSVVLGVFAFRTSGISSLISRRPSFKVASAPSHRGFHVTFATVLDIQNFELALLSSREFLNLISLGGIHINVLLHNVWCPLHTMTLSSILRGFVEDYLGPVLSLAQATDVVSIGKVQLSTEQVL